MTEPIRHRPQRLRACHRIVIDKSDQGNVRVSSIHDARVRAASPEAECLAPDNAQAVGTAQSRFVVRPRGGGAVRRARTCSSSYKARTRHVPRLKTMSSSRKARSAGGIFIMALIKQPACHAFPNGPAACTTASHTKHCLLRFEPRLPQGDLGPRFPPSMGGKRRQRVRRDIEGAEMEFLAGDLVGQGVLPE